MQSRRQFLSTAAAPAAFSLAPLLQPAGARERLADLAATPGTPGQLAGDEDFWGEIGRCFSVDRSLVNLNNGGVSPSPIWVQEAVKRHLDYSNQAPPYTMWRVLEPQREGVRQRLARHWGVDPEEVALTRNASESLQTCQLGFDLRAGDEVLTTDQDYPRMLAAFEQRRRREGIVVNTFALPVPCEDPEIAVRLFEERITPRTKLILACHVVNLTGQILPVKEIAAMARRRGVPLIVDGAHALAHFEFLLSDLEVDYYGSSLHKWLFAPHGTGFLYVRRDRIAGLWPLMAADEKLSGDVRKFEEIGTHPAAGYLAIAEALTFHQLIGGRRKEARLRYLRDSWATRLLAGGRVKLHTSLKPEFSCGIANFAVEGVDPDKLGAWLWDKHRILCTPILHRDCPGIRVTPSVYTTMEELDRFVEAVEHVIRNGLPA